MCVGVAKVWWIETGNIHVDASWSDNEIPGKGIFVFLGIGISSLARIYQTKQVL